ncbi:MAG: hypothetical protein ABI599_10550 [Flavobacteriales bacterium]
MRLVLLSSAFLTSVTGLLGQDHILLMNGQTIDAKVIGQSTLEVRYALITKGKVKEREEPTENVFSVTDSLNVEKLWYFQDSLFGNDFSVQEMRHYIRGEQDARKGYKPIIPMIGGFVAGAGLVIGLDMEFMALLIPPVYGGAMALPRVHVTKGSITNPLMDGDNFYAYGYARAGRNKRIIRSLLSSAVGVAVGLGLNQFVIKPNEGSVD